MAINRIALITLSILLFEHCTTVTLTRFTQQRTDVPRANPTVVVLLTEMLKLVLALWLETTHTFGLGTSSSFSAIVGLVKSAPLETLKVSVPAFLYTIQNISIFYALGNIEVVSFQVLYQTKLMLTAVLSVVFLGRRLTPRQWLALVTLTVGVIAVELSDASLKKSVASATTAPQKKRSGGEADGRRLLSGAASGADGGRVRHGGRRSLLFEPESEAPLGMLWGAESPEVEEEQSWPYATVGGSEGRSGSDGDRKNGSGVGGSEGGEGGDSSGGASGVVSAYAGRVLSSEAEGPRSLASTDDELLSAEGSGGRHGAKHRHSKKQPAQAAAAGAVASEKNAFFGLVAALLAATLSSFAGVYFEVLVKGKEAKPPSLWVRNVQLCLFTIPLAALAVAGQWSKVSAHGLLTGVDAPTVVLISLNASGGLLVAAVIKYGDNILKNFTTSCSVILGTLISVQLFDFQLSMQFVYGSALVVLSAYAYATAPPLPEPPEDSAKEPEKGLLQGNNSDESEVGDPTPPPSPSPGESPGISPA